MPVETQIENAHKSLPFVRIVTRMISFVTMLFLSTMAMNYHVVNLLYPVMIFIVVILIFMNNFMIYIFSAVNVRPKFFLHMI